MADFKIKSTAGTGNKTLIQSQDQSGSSYAIQVGDAGATTLTNATITAGTFPAGHIIQTVSAKKTGEDSSAMSSSTFQKVVDSSGNAEWGADITGVTAGNDVLVSATWCGYIVSGAANQGGAWGFIRGTTNIYYHVAGHSDWENQQDNWYSTMHLQYLDSNPGSGSHSYYLGCREYQNATVQVNSTASGLPFQMILQEIQR